MDDSKIDGRTEGSKQGTWLAKEIYGWHEQSWTHSESVSKLVGKRR